MAVRPGAAENGDRFPIQPPEHGAAREVVPEPDEIGGDPTGIERLSVEIKTLIDDRQLEIHLAGNGHQEPKANVVRCAALPADDEAVDTGGFGPLDVLPNDVGIAARI